MSHRGIFIIRTSGELKGLLLLVEIPYGLHVIHGRDGVVEVQWDLVSVHLCSPLFALSSLLGPRA